MSNTDTTVDSPAPFASVVECMDFIDYEMPKVLQVLSTVSQSCRALATVDEEHGFGSNDINAGLTGFPVILASVNERLEQIRLAAVRMYDLSTGGAR